MFCQSCGEILPDGAHFCPKCGQSCAAQVEIPDNINFSFDDELTPVDKETEVVCRKTTTDKETSTPEKKKPAATHTDAPAIGSIEWRYWNENGSHNGLAEYYDGTLFTIPFVPNGDDITSDTTSEYYYVGKTKDNRPDGFGMIFGMSTGSGTYALADGFMIHYIGDFKNGAYDGFGALFSADEYDLSGMINNIVQSGEITSDEVLENAVEYLFNYVSYEGHFKDGKMNGKGNEFSFPNVEVGLPFDFNNDPIDGYRYYNIYPDVIMGEYKNNALTGMVKEYWHNHLWYSGEMDDGQESGKGAWYYNNGQVMYEGEFKKGKQSGKGSYYDENGNLIYSGEWENGDYAH